MCPATFQFAQNKQEMIEQAKDSLVKVAPRMKKYANQNMRDVKFRVRGKVMLKLTPHIWKKFSSKTVHRRLVQKYNGPFEVIKRVGSVAYQLKLPDPLKVHPTFHMNYLKPFNENLMGKDRLWAKRAPHMSRNSMEGGGKDFGSSNNGGQVRKGLISGPMERH